MNTYAKYCPNVWLAQCEGEHTKGDIVPVANKHGKETDCEIHNLILSKNGLNYYSITRCDGLNRQTYAQRKAEKYATWAASAHKRSSEWMEKSNEGREFLSLAEPIKVGHHSEKRHRALIDRNWNRVGNAVAESDKAEQHDLKASYWESMTGKVDLSMPESVEYFEHELQKSEANHKELKDDQAKRAHSMSLSYASKNVKDLKNKVETAKKLWL
jgi:hypothetical protein